jgi:hypothetical protein
MKKFQYPQWIKLILIIAGFARSAMMDAFRIALAWSDPAIALKCQRVAAKKHVSDHLLVSSAEKTSASRLQSHNYHCL